ncbi:MAG TPA: LuxR C-terminal-related transcriptional regulator [Solirubrobacterales bacterium]|nr:LuxR C-terminal-related transcriptional regulator [Solirubrobacterales bacterium]
MGAFDSEVSANRKAFAESRFGSEVVTRLRAAFGRSKHAILILDDERRWVTANHAAADLLATPLDEIPWHKIDDFAPPASQPDIEANWKAFLSNGSAEGWTRLIVPGHTQIQVEYSAIAKILPGRHLITYVTPDEDFPEKAEDLARSAAATTDSDRQGEQTQLTEREREVLMHVSTGLQTREIAETLFLSPETVKSHVQNALEKLGARTRAHAVAMALMGGQITFQS